MRFEVRESLTALCGTAATARVALSRGKTPLVLDENLLFLKELLEKKGFNVLIPKGNKQDSEIMVEDLPGRIYVTDTPKDFIYSASLLDYSIICTKNVSEDPQALADMIAHAWVDSSLKAEHPAFYLVLRQNGRHEITTGI